MQQYFIVPDRKISGLGVGVDAVLSVNGLQGDIALEAGYGITIPAPVGGALTIGVVQDMFVLRNGDQFLGNLDFTPANSATYGLKLVAQNTDPTAGNIGAIYYNTSSNTLRIYDVGGWEDLAQTGALTTGTADTRYLKLDGSNGPMTGNLSMGSSLLRFANLNSNPGTASAGQVYFNTMSDNLLVYTGSAWANVGGGVTSVGAGSGLLTDQTSDAPITSTGNLSINYAVSPTWTGTHSFTNPIVFSSTQTFAVNKLAAASQTTGDIIAFIGGVWTRVGIGATGNILTVSGGIPSWQAPSTSGTGITLGVPTDGTYTDGFFSTWTAGTTLDADAFDQINELLKAIAPAAGTAIDGSVLTLTGNTYYTAKVSAGLTSAVWYEGGASSGSTITTYAVANSISLATASPVSAFGLGLQTTPSSYGTLYLEETEANTTSAPISFNLTTNTNGSTSAGNYTLAVAFSNYNSIWRIGSATATRAFTSGDDGYLVYWMRQTTGSNHDSAAQTFYRDAYSAANPNPSFSSAAVIGAVNSDVAKWLSGVRYYGLNSQLRVDYVAASGIFYSCYHPTNVATILGVGAPTGSPSQFNPTATPTYNSAWSCTGSSNGQVVNLSVANQATTQNSSGTYTNQYLTVALFKPTGNSATSNAALARAVCTYGDVSTVTYEAFFDEDYRLPLSSFPGTGTWTPTSPIANGDAQVRNGVLRYPITADYTGITFSGNQEYQRIFTISGRKTGTFTFDTSFNMTSVAPYGTGSLNLLMYLAGDALWFDLGVLVGTNLNLSSQVRDGSTRAKAFGAQNSGSSGKVLNWSTGLFTTGPPGGSNNAQFRFVATFLDSTVRIQSITIS